MGQLLEAQQFSKFYSLFYHRFPDSREHIIIFISVSAVGMSVRPGNCRGNKSFGN
jgi:hypothetical protein